MNKGIWFLSRRKLFLTVVNVASVCIGLVVVSIYTPGSPTVLGLIDQCALGLYASGVSIHHNPAGSVFSCGARS